MRQENQPITTAFTNALRSLPGAVFEGIVKATVNMTEFTGYSQDKKKVAIKNKYALDVTSQQPFFCIYENTSELLKPISPGNKKSLNPLMAVYKEIDVLNTQSVENIRYQWVVKFFVNPIDECDDTRDGKIRDLIDFWSQDQQLCVALGSFLHTQITSAKDLKTFIINLRFSSLITQRLEEADYNDVFVFFIKHFKNNFIELSIEKNELMVIFLTGFPNPDHLEKRAVINKIFDELSCFALPDFTPAELTEFKNQVLKQPFSAHTSEELFQVIRKVQLIDERKANHQLVLFTFDEMRALKNFLVKINQENFSKKVLALMCNDALFKFIHNIDRLEYLIHHVARLPDDYISRIVSILSDKVKLETLIINSDPNCIVDKLISIVTSDEIELPCRIKIWEMVRGKLPKLIQNIDQFVRVLALPFLEMRDYRIAFMSGSTDYFDHWINHNDDLRRFIRAFHFSVDEADKTLRDFIWDQLKIRFLRNVKTVEQLDGFLTCDDLTESQRSELRNKIIEAGWVSNAGQVIAVRKSCQLSLQEKITVTDNVVERFGTPLSDQAKYSDPDVPSVSQFSNESADPLQPPSELQRVACIFENTEQFIDLFNLIGDDKPRRHLFLDALKHRLFDIIASSSDFLKFFEECNLTQIEQDEIWEASKSTIIRKLIDGEFSFEILSSQRLSVSHFNELLIQVAPHQKKMIANLKSFLRFYDSARFDAGYRQLLLNSFETELQSWIKDSDALFEVINFALSDDKFDAIWSRIIPTVIAELLRKKAYDEFIEIINCPLLTRTQRDPLCNSNVLINACFIDNLADLLTLIQTGKLTFTQQEKIFSAIGSLSLRNMIYKEGIKSLDAFLSCDYLDVSISVIQEAIFSRSNLCVFKEWDDKITTLMDRQFNLFDIDPELEDADTLIKYFLEILRLDYRKRILTTSCNQSSCCSFFSSADKLNHSLTEKIIAIEQILDEMNDREMYSPDIDQSSIQKKKESGRIFQLLSLWEQVKMHRAERNIVSDRGEQDPALFSPK